jgi:sulfide:quinone oxidoreductase
MAQPVQKIVIVGGGTGGTLAANLLAKHLRKQIKNEETKVFLVSGSKYHSFQPGLLEIAFEGKNPRKLIREERSLVNRDVSYIEEKVDKIDLHAQEVLLETGRKLPYDHLIIATGSVPYPEAIPGLASGSLNFHTGPEQSLKIWNAIQQIEKGQVVVGIAGLPHKCPPSPNEAVFLLDDYLRKHGKRDSVNITFLTPYPRPYPAEPMSKVVEPRFKKRGIKVVTFFNVESVDPAKKELYSLEGETYTYDLLVMVPPHRGADVIIKSGIGDRDGWIPTDKHTMKITGHENAYAIGDATNIPVSKTGVTAHLEAIVAANNIVSSVLNLGELHNYSGRINCPFEMGAGKASFVVGSYEDPVHQIQPSRIRHLMKRGFERFYWRTLSGRWDWLLDAYFGKTDLVEKQPASPSTVQ